MATHSLVTVGRMGSYRRSRCGRLFVVVVLAAATACIPTGSDTSPRSPATRSSPETASPPVIPSPLTGARPPDSPATNSGQDLIFEECNTIAWPEVATVGDVPENRNPTDEPTETANSYARSQPEVFGGSWVDRRHGGTYVLAFTDDLDRHRSALEEVLPSSFAFDVVAVDHTEAELVAVLESLQNGTAGTFESVGYDTRINRIAFGYLDPTPAELRLLAEQVPVELVCLEITETVVPPSGPLDVIYEPGDDPLLRCWGHPAFRLSDFQDSQPVDEFDHPAVEAFRNGVAQGWSPLEFPASDWGVVAVEEEWVVFASSGSAPAVATVSWSGREWTFTGGRPACELQLATPSGLQPVAWKVRPRPSSIEGDGTVVHLHVTEETCADEDDFRTRLRGAQVEERADEMVIALASDGWYGYHACFSGPEIAIEVQLSEPLGDRRLIDGLDIPVGLLE